MKQTTFQHKYAPGSRVIHDGQERTVTSVMANVYTKDGIAIVGYHLDHEAQYVMESDLMESGLSAASAFDPNDLVRIRNVHGNAVWSRKDVPDIPDDELVLVCAAADRKDIKP